METIQLGYFTFDNKGDESELFEQFLGNNEEILYAFKGIRDEVVFTNKRVITLNLQGFSGKKKEFVFIHYKKLTSYIVESAGNFDIDSEVKLIIGNVKYEFELGNDIDVFPIAKLISDNV